MTNSEQALYLFLVLAADNDSLAERSACHQRSARRPVRSVPLSHFGRMSADCLKNRSIRVGSSPQFV
jgi:hypothetical protein